MTTVEVLGLIFGGGMLGSVVGVGVAVGMARRALDYHEERLEKHEECLDWMRRELERIRQDTAGMSRDIAWLVRTVRANGGKLSAEARNE